MTFPQNTNFLRWLIIIASFIIISLILWNTYVFFQNFKAEERAKMDIWAKAQIEFQKSSLTENINPIISKIISSDSLNPKIVVYKDNRMSTVNIKGVRANDSLYLQQLVLKFENENTDYYVATLDREIKNKIKNSKIVIREKKRLEII